MTRFTPLDLGRLKTRSLKDRPSKVSRSDFGRPWTKGGRLDEFIARLPGILAAGEFKEAVDRLARAAAGGRTVILALGGHPLKVGLAPLIIDLMERGVISLLAGNGSVMVHDAELAMVGSTSEDVAATLGHGDFGVTREANELINAAAGRAAREGLGLGRALGEALRQGGYPYESDSIFAAAARLDLPFTVHVALGTDVYHIHPAAEGADLGRASMADFRTFCSAVATLESGVFLNLGSAVIMPEVFLKAVTLARNLGHRLEDLTTINMDFVRHYRPAVNVVQRPTAQGGRGVYLIGHHEIMFPLLAAALIERLEEPRQGD
ncbi:MAG: hypothetical protein AB1896_06440 [Thermodesulfobacteriota bacterium]